MAILEATRPSGDRAGKGTFFVTEEFGFQQIVRDGSAVNHEHLLFSARAVFVHRAGDEFLAGAAFPAH